MLGLQTSPDMVTTLTTVKVVVAGDGAVGKTSLIRRYCEGKFAGSRVMTIGVDFQTKRNGRTYVSVLPAKLEAAE